MAATVDPAALAELRNQPFDWRFKGLPAQWSGRTPADICAEMPNFFDSAPLGPMCVLRADALNHNLATMARWCAERGVELSPHGKTHMSPQLAALQFGAGATAITVATIGQLRIYRAFGVNTFLLANELVDRGGLRWLAAELNSDPQLRVVCWVDSAAGVEIMRAELVAAGANRPLDVCVEVGAPGARTGTRDSAAIDEVVRAVTTAPQLRLVGVAAYEAALGHDVTEPARERIRNFLAGVRSTALRVAEAVDSDEILVTAGGSTHFDLVAEVLGPGTADSFGGRTLRTVLRSGCYLTHDDGLYRRTSPFTRAGAVNRLRPALSVWGQVCSRPEPDLALLTLGRRDVSFDQDLPVPRGVPGATVTKLNDQHTFLRLASDASRLAAVGDWIEFGISHPCTVFDKWQVIPVLDDEDRVVDLVRTFF